MSAGKDGGMAGILRALVDVRREITREDVATALGVDMSMVSRYLSGQHPIPAHLAVALAVMGHPQLLEDMCMRAGGRFCPGGVAAKCARAASSAGEALSVSSAVTGVVAAYVGELAQAAEDGIVEPREHRGLYEVARKARREFEGLERYHGARGGVQ